jgi:hypothetical protein
LAGFSSLLLCLRVRLIFFGFLKTFIDSFQTFQNSKSFIKEMSHFYSTTNTDDSSLYLKNITSLILRIAMGLDHPLDGITNPKYKLLHLIKTKFFCKEKKALAFNRDSCCHLVLCLQLILFHLYHKPCNFYYVLVSCLHFASQCVY